MFRFRPGLMFAFGCLGFLGGVAALSFEVPWWTSFLIFIVLVLLRKISCRPKDLLCFGVVFLIASLIGAWRYEKIQPTIRSALFVADSEKHEVEGTIVRISENDASVKLVLDGVFVDGEEREDRVLVKASLFSKVLVGERVSVSCPLKRPEAFDDFAYDRYLAAKDIVATCSASGLPFILGQDRGLGVKILASVDRLHAFLVEQIDTVLPDPHAQLLAGLLIGDDAFSQTWKERFLRTGTSHIVAASGSNVALTVSILLAILFGLGVRRAYTTFFVLLGIAVFVLLAGGESAVLRAGIMASLVVFSRASGRASSVRNVLLCTVCVMLWFEPRILRSDVGFQLSVLSTIGLIWWSASFSAYLSFLPEKFGIREGFATTLAATLATLPVTAFGMGQISLVGPLANLLVLPLLPLAMVTGTVAVVIGMVVPVFGRIVAFPAWWILDTVLMVLRELAALPFVYMEVQEWMLNACLTFGGIAVAVLRHMLRFIQRRGNADVRQRREDSDVRMDLAMRLVPMFLFGGLFIASFVQHVIRDGWFSSDVRVWVFNIGQGDGIFIDTPGKDVVIDGGPSFVMREKIGTALPWFDRSIDYVFMTHPHTDHFVGLVPLFTQYNVDVFGEDEQGCTTFECHGLRVVAPAPYSVSSGDTFILAPGVTLRTVWPPAAYGNVKLSDPNDGSLVFYLETPGGSMLFTGDAGIEQEEQFIPSLPDHVDVIKIGHHGSRTSTSDAFLEALTPSMAIISLGEGNSFGHPHQETLDRLQKYGVSVYRTDEVGDICVVFEKHSVRVVGVSL